MSYLIATKTDEVVPLRELYRLAVQFIFEKDKFNYAMEFKLRQGLAKWINHVNEQKAIQFEKFKDTSVYEGEIGKKGTPLDELEYKIGLLAQLIYKEDHGQFAKWKYTVKLHKLDWRKIMGNGELFPEAYKPEDFKKAQMYYEKAKKEHPEDYKPSK